MKVQILNQAGEVRVELTVTPSRWFKMLGKWQYLDAIEEAVKQVAIEEYGQADSPESESANDK